MSVVRGCESLTGGNVIVMVDGLHDVTGLVQRHLAQLLSSLDGTIRENEQG